MAVLQRSDTGEEHHKRSMEAGLGPFPPKSREVPEPRQLLERANTHEDHVGGSCLRRRKGVLGIREHGPQQLVAFLDMGALIPRAGPLQNSQ